MGKTLYKNSTLFLDGKMKWHIYLELIKHKNKVIFKLLVLSLSIYNYSIQIISFLGQGLGVILNFFPLPPPTALLPFSKGKFINKNILSKNLFQENEIYA